jgi:predicted ATPase
MLKRLYIDNFRCFVNFEYKPERKQLLLGANGSGKSSLLEAVRLLKSFLSGGELPFTQSSRTRWQDKPLQVFEIDALIEGKLFSYRTEILYASKTNAPSVNMERLSVEGAPVFEFIDGEMRSYVDGASLAIPQHRDKTESSLHFWAGPNPSVSQFVEWMDTVHCFKIDAYEDKMEETADSILLVPDYELEYMASWYRHLNESDPEGMDAFRSSMREVLSGFLNLRLSSEDDGVKKLRADFTSPTQKKLTISLHELSDGQRILIAIYMILHFLIAKGHTVFIDEPDNFVSSREIQPWLLSAEDALEESKGQLILISHHPEILNYWAREYGLLFSREENGHVRTKAYREVADTGLDPAETIARGWEDE